MNTKANLKKQHKKKIILTTLAVGASGILGYFGWQYYKKKKEKNNSEPSVTFSPKAVRDEAPVIIDTPIYKPPRPVRYSSTININRDGFPLKRGSKGEKVRALQEALIAKHGRQILPRYGADGDFGSETAAALKKLKLPASIDESTYNVLVKGKSTASGNSSLGKQFFTAASKKDFAGTIRLLKQLNTKEDYKTASDEFKNYRLNGGVRQTLVNGLLNSFILEEQKQAIRFEFLRMGLQFDGSKWSLDGFDGITIVTKEPAFVWVNSKQRIKVPAKMVLGSEVSRRLDYTLFENKGKHFLIQTKSVKHL